MRLLKLGMMQQYHVMKEDFGVAVFRAFSAVGVKVFLVLFTAFPPLNLGRLDLFFAPFQLPCPQCQKSCPPILRLLDFLPLDQPTAFFNKIYW
jgi:hypothetical protein